MARTELTPQSLVIAGITETFVAAITDGHMASFNGRPLILHFKCTGGSPSTITFLTPGKHDGLTITAPTLVVPATTGDKVIMIPLSDAFIQSDGRLYWDYSPITNVTVAVLRP